MISLVTIIFSSRNLVESILVFKGGGARFSLVTAFLLGGNHPLTFTIPLGLLASHFFRSLGIPCSLYIDDRHTGQLCLDPRFVPTAYQNLNSPKDVSLSLAKAAIFVVCFTLVSLGYFLGLEKSILVPSIRVPYLGFISNSHLQAFTLLPSKKAKFLDLLKSALSSSHIELLSLQKLAGKCVSESRSSRSQAFYQRD